MGSTVESHVGEIRQGLPVEAPKGPQVTTLFEKGEATAALMLFLRETNVSQVVFHG